MRVRVRQASALFIGVLTTIPRVAGLPDRNDTR